MVNPVLRNLPSVNELLESPPLKSLVTRVSQNAVVARVRAMLDDVRREVQSAAADARLPNVTELAERMARRILVSPTPHSWRPIINATGAVFDPRLGHPPLADEAVTEASAVARDYLNLEVDLHDGSPASRSAAVETLLCELTGAEAALVVNHHAGALMLALAALAAGREVIVSRGQIFELDPGYRLPDAAAASGAQLREVGTTNATTLDDYALAIDDRTAAVLVVEPAHRAAGDTAGRVPLEPLATLAHGKRLPLVQSLGDASIIELSTWGLTDWPLLGDCVRGGADLVLTRGDRMIGGPQCGIVVGRREVVERLARHPWARALQPEPMVLAALAGTLRLYRDPLLARRAVPALSLLATPVENLQHRAERLAPRLATSPAVSLAEPVASIAAIGGQASDRGTPTWCVSILPEGRTAEQFSHELLSARPPVLTRVAGDRVLVDLRSVPPRLDQQLVSALATLGGAEASQAQGG